MKSILVTLLVAIIPLLSFSQDGKSPLHLVHDTATYNTSGNLQGGGGFNVLTNDQRNLCDGTYAGINIPLAVNTITLVGSATFPPYFKIMNTGVVNVDVNAGGGAIPVGTYTLSYTVCDLTYPAICATQTLTIMVTNSFKMAASAKPTPVIQNGTYTAKNALQIINFPDANLKAVLIQLNNGRIYNVSNTDYIDADANHDGEIDTDEALLVGGLNLSGDNISDLTGLEYFTNITSIAAINNNIVSYSLIIPNLQILNLWQNPLISLNTSNLPNLNKLIIFNTQLTTLETSNNPLLSFINMSNTHISNLDLGTNHNLSNLLLKDNANLTTINIKNTSSLDYSNSFMLQDCWVNCPNLNNICADADEIPALQSYLAGCGVSTSGININSDCALGTEPFTATTVAIHPNPVTNSFTIDFVSPIAETSSYEVYDVLGKKVLEGVIASGVSNVSISFENYPQGVYLLRLKAGDKMISKKIIKE